MKMSKVVCCDDCFASIGKRNTSAAIMWLELCRLKSESGLFGLRTQDFPELRTLELLGFITTTEVPDVILVKVHGDQEQYFCKGDCGGPD